TATWDPDGAERCERADRGADGSKKFPAEKVNHRVDVGVCATAAAGRAPAGAAVARGSPSNWCWGRMRVLAAAVVLGPTLAACGSSGGGGGKTVNWYVFKEPGGAYDQAAASCTKQAGGRYSVKIVPLPTNADQQRELLVRRLAAKDSSVDVLGMDVIWTGEFAEAGWIRAFSSNDATAISTGALQGPVKSGTYKNRLYAAPFTSNTQLLWYRKDRVANPPQTWDEVIDAAVKLHDQTHQPNYVEVQAS